MTEFLTLEDVDVKGKTVFLRIDANVPYDEKKGKISDSDRLKEHAKTIKELSDKEAKLVVLSHQGRKGDPDFIHLDQHAALLETHIGKKVEFVDDIIGDKAKQKIKSLIPGQILLLDNVRFLDDETDNKTPEEHKNSSIVKTLSPFTDVFINDAFSAAHRSHASIVGFTATVPSYAGRTMSREVEKLDGIIKTMKKSKYDTFVLGGAKPKDPLDVMGSMLEKKILEKALVGGIVGELFLIAEGHDLGATKNFLEEKKYTEFLPQTRKLLKKYEERIEIPVDIALEKDGKRVEISVEELPTDSLILDIGDKTIKKYNDIIKNSTTIGFKGPVGKYEKDAFTVGTKSILEAIANSEGKTLVGGGHTLDALHKLKIDKEKFTHVSLGGGSLIKFLSDKPMPAIEALKNANK